MTSNLRGKHIWIIGASAGIGAVLAEKFAAQGALIAASARSETGLNELIARLPGVGHLVIPMDVTDEQSVKAAAQKVRGAWPAIDKVIYNAGTYKQMSVKNFDLAEVNKMLDTNLRGVFYLLDAILPMFKQQKEGHLALVSSVAGFRGLPNSMGYGASKAGLINLAEELRAEMKPWRVKVQLINPGFVKTRLVESNKFPMPFIISPEQAADYIIRGMEGNGFEIHFPKRFTLLLKLVGMLPDPLYFAVMKFLL